MAKTNCGILLQKRSLVRIHKATSHLNNVKEEKRIQNRKEAAIRFKKSIESMESKIEVINYLIK